MGKMQKSLALNKGKESAVFACKTWLCQEASRKTVGLSRN